MRRPCWTSVSTCVSSRRRRSKAWAPSGRGLRGGRLWWYTAAQASDAQVGRTTAALSYPADSPLCLPVFTRVPVLWGCPRLCAPSEVWRPTPGNGFATDIVISLSLPVSVLLVRCPGTFCTLDICLARLEDIGTVDVRQTVRRMRGQRAFSIQTWDQYYFCYTAVIEHAQRNGKLSPVQWSDSDLETDSE